MKRGGKIVGRRWDWLIEQVSAFKNNAADLAEQLGDKDIATRNGFTPVKVTQQGVHAAIQRIPRDVLIEKRRAYMNSFIDVELAHSRARVEKLVAMIGEVGSCDNLSPSGKLKLKAQFLNQIKDEIGEDVDKIADALGRSGSDHHHFYLGPIDASEEQQLDGSLGVIFGRNGDRFRSADN